MRKLIAVLAILWTTSVQAQEPHCDPISAMEVHFQKVFPGVRQVVLDKEATARYLKKYNLLGDFTRHYGDAMLLNVLHSGTVLAFIVQDGGRNCLRIQISGPVHRKILSLLKKGKPT